MNVNNQSYRTIWEKESESGIIQIIDQRHLPHQFVIEDISSTEQMATAIRDMHLRGAPLIGAAAGYGMYLAVINEPPSYGFEQELSAPNGADDIRSFDYLQKMAAMLLQTRPTAVNLSWAINQQLEALALCNSHEEQLNTSLKIARKITSSSVDKCFQIGQYGLALIEEISSLKRGATVNILTHCNAGWLACVDYGTATAPIYAAHQKGIDLHIWVDETRPRNQGARLTAWELLQAGIPHTIISDNVGGHLMQHGLVDMVLVGSDRTTRRGDVANKIGTYLKALAAKDNDIPFYVALPSSTIDWNLSDGIKEIPIEERHANEVKYIQGMTETGIQKVLLTPEASPATNFGFDVTPAHLVTGLITEKGICAANEKEMLEFFFTS